MQSGFSILNEEIRKRHAELVRRMLQGIYGAGAAEGRLMSEWQEEPCSHSFVDTGMRKSWCKHCDCEGLFVNGKYEEAK